MKQKKLLRQNNMLKNLFVNSESTTFEEKLRWKEYGSLILQLNDLNELNEFDKEKLNEIKKELNNKKGSF